MKLFSRLAIVLCISAVALAQEAARPLTNQDIVDLVEVGLSPDVVVQKVRTARNTAFDTSVEGLKALKQAEVPDEVIKAMVSSSAQSSASAPAEHPAVKFAPGSKVYIAPMSGFETYLSAAIQKKHVPIVVVSDRSRADFEIVGNSDTQKAGWAKIVFTRSTQSDEQASISVASIGTGEVVFAYAVNKRNSVHGKQSAAEACAKHLKEKLESKDKD